MSEFEKQERFYPVAERLRTSSTGSTDRRMRLCGDRTLLLSNSILLRLYHGSIERWNFAYSTAVLACYDMEMTFCGRWSSLVATAQSENLKIDRTLTISSPFDHKMLQIVRRHPRICRLPRAQRTERSAGASKTIGYAASQVFV